MDALSLAAIVQHNWEIVAAGSYHSYEPQSTWAGDLSIAMFYEKVEPGAIERTISDAINNWKNEPDHRMLIMLGCAINFMSWWCYEIDEWKEYSKFFSDRYYQYIDQMDKIDPSIYSKIYYYLDQKAPDISRTPPETFNRAS